MPIRVVRLGSPRVPDEGLRLGTVRRPPRGVPKERFAKDDWYDVWLPTLAPSDELRVEYTNSTAKNARATFERKYRAEMKAAEHVLNTLAALSHQTSFSVGCYCEDESRCHRSVLREMLVERGGEVV
jgi:uncharacterized protein YeaO (DUF488 family)